MYSDVGWAGAILGAFLVLLFGFLFVTVSSRLTGEIGSSSNPISGMTVATLLMTCLIFLAVGRTSPQDAVLALSIGGVVCIAASNGGTTSQDLKTGFLVGGTPRWQQWAIIVGALTSALVIGFTLLLFNSAGNVYSHARFARRESQGSPCRPQGDGNLRQHGLPRLEAHAGRPDGVEGKARQIPGGRQRPGLLPDRSHHHRRTQAARRLEAEGPVRSKLQSRPRKPERDGSAPRKGAEFTPGDVPCLEQHQGVGGGGEQQRRQAEGGLFRRSGGRISGGRHRRRASTRTIRRR